VAALRQKVRVEVAPLRGGVIDLRWLMRKLGRENITSLLVEGGGEVNASFLLGGFARRVAFFYAPKIIGGRAAHKGVAGAGITDLKQALELRDVTYRWLGEDLLLTALLAA
jgi:diaminohydroxyphosphoribosylaminopyrimidine deaminase/5-amino-6-(5-phosphoribosylamino)uracil reductase